MIEINKPSKKVVSWMLAFNVAASLMLTSLIANLVMNYMDPTLIGRVGIALCAIPVYFLVVHIVGFFTGSAVGLYCGVTYGWRCAKAGQAPHPKYGRMLGRSVLETSNDVFK